MGNPTSPEEMGSTLPAFENFDLNELGTWAEPIGTSDLIRFGYFGTGRGFIIEPTHQVLGTSSDGPVTGTGTATWTGIVIGKEHPRDGDRFLDGVVAATMDLADITKLTVEFTRLSFQGSDTAVPDIHDELTFKPERNSWFGMWTGAQFYAVGEDSTGMVAGTVERSTWAGSWGAAKD